MSTVARLLKAVILGVVLTFLVLTTSFSELLPTPMPPTAAPSRSPDPRTVELIARLGCSATELPRGVAPRRAIVRLPIGLGGSRVQVTSFARGWAVYLRERPGRLVAVCP